MDYGIQNHKKMRGNGKELKSGSVCLVGKKHVNSLHLGKRKNIESQRESISFKCQNPIFVHSFIHFPTFTNHAYALQKGFKFMNLSQSQPTLNSLVFRGGDVMILMGFELKTS